MEAKPITEEMRAVCNRLSADITALHRLSGGLPEGPARGEIFKALFELTRQVEVVKKQVKRVESAGETAGPAL